MPRPARPNCRRSKQKPPLCAVEMAGGRWQVAGGSGPMASVVRCSAAQCSAVQSTGQGAVRHGMAFASFARPFACRHSAEWAYFFSCVREALLHEAAVIIHVRRLPQSMQRPTMHTHARSHTNAQRRTGENRNTEANVPVGHRTQMPQDTNAQEATGGRQADVGNVGEHLVLIGGEQLFCE